ncbi:MAG TPA: nodulation protein NfeD [Candidatus Saccharimonadales bacterium]|nr:nodulation protein NfeD [Candidatus Saccharimonadales bacterium]
MRRLLPPALLLTLLFPSAANAAEVLRARIDGVIHGITAEYVRRAVDRADSDHADLLVITINTPGGLVSSTEEIIESLLASKAPVVLFVAPSGARAASAGFYITLSADVAAMAPGTRIGAAHPVMAFGENNKKDIEMQKAENDLAAQARSIAQNRHRNVEVAEKIVRDSVSLTEKEALDQHLIDLVCRDMDDLLKQLDGRTVTRFDGSKVVLHLEGAVVKDFEMTTRQKILAAVSDPTVAFILFILGLLGLYVEFTHPGMILPGVVGALSLLLFAISTQILPLNLLGLLLIGLGIGLFVLEIKVTSYGLLTIGGVVAITFGFLTLFEGPVPEMRLPLSAVLPVSLTVAAIMAFLTHRVIRSHFWKVATGAEGIQGEIGTALTEVAATGKVFVHGEYWNATSREPIAAGQRVRVRSVKDLTIEVERVEPT